MPREAFATLNSSEREWGAEVDEDEQDPLYDDAVSLVLESRQCSMSWLQSSLGLGYNRAARIIEMMERRGLVGTAARNKDRRVLVAA